jgi:hypothetical protein
MRIRFCLLEMNKIFCLLSIRTIDHQASSDMIALLYSAFSGSWPIGKPIKPPTTDFPRALRCVSAGGLSEVVGTLVAHWRRDREKGLILLWPCR